jgi:hypothetical protein
VKWFNSNVVHNVLNVLMAVNGFILYLGCTSVNGVASCTQTWIPASMAASIVAFGAVLKIVINIGRDGFGGLIKAQPPVADSMTTVVTPVKVVEKK